MIESTLIFLVIIYCFFILLMWLGWERIPIKLEQDYRPSVAILIPIRNEIKTIKNLLYSLQNQTYTGLLEVIIINDHSNDNSPKLIQKIINNIPNQKLIHLEEEAGKKFALAKGINNTNAEIILTLDGDCIAPTTWVDSMVSNFTKKTQFVSAPIQLIRESSVFNKLQAIEFASLIGGGAALIGWGKPIIANGANMAFRRKAFLAVGGFDGNYNIASGDDIFLLHKFAVNYPNNIVFAKQEGCIIKTTAQKNVASFVQQRIRWASKWKAYKNPFAKFMTLCIFIVSLNFMILPLLLIYQKNSLFLVLNLFTIKVFFDYFFIKHISNFLESKVNPLIFIGFQLIYPFYIVIIAFLSFQNAYFWKGRKVKIN